MFPNSYQESYLAKTKLNPSKRLKFPGKKNQIKARPGHTMTGFFEEESLPEAKPRTQSTQVPRIHYKHLKMQNFDKDTDQHRYFYKPCSLKLSPRCTVTVYSPSPLGDSPKVKHREQTTIKKKKTTENVEVPKTAVKLTRITSSKISFPAVNIGQVMMRVKDLVIDPLKQEFR
jgi:hypothetical protein